MTVSIPSRVFDASIDAQVATVTALLRELHMSHACVQKQKVALATWLLIHEPQRSLRISLLENGYGLLLKETDDKRANSGCLA